MRQVMPHRNNIVADRRRRKCFLCPVDSRPLNSEHCDIPARTGQALVERK
jgi:hypothetical protein